MKLLEQVPTESLKNENEVQFEEEQNKKRGI